VSKKIILFITWLALLIFWLDFFTQLWTYFFLDTIFYPIYTLQDFFSQALYWHLRDILTMILWYELYSKIFLLWIFIIWATLWVYTGKLVNKILKIKNNKIKLFNIILWISFILLNPFSYERFITQTDIILWIYLIWLWLIFLIDYLILSAKSKKLYISSLFFWLSLTIFPHSAIFLIIIALTTLIFYLRKFSLKRIFFSIIIVLFINLNWVIWNIFLWTKNSLEKINNFDYKNIEVFANNSLNNLWTEVTNLLLYWFWWEKYKHLYTPDIINDKWYLAWFLIVIIIVFWIIFLYKKQKRLTLYLLSIWIISYILSLWISSELMIGINMFLYNNIPYYIWMREPQKLTGLVMLIYSLFFIVWISSIITIMKKFKLKQYLHTFILNYYFWFILLLLIITAWSPNVLFWFNHQLRISNYPTSFFQAKSFLQEHSPNSKSVLFPWHSYIKCSWTKWKVISNIIPNILKPANIISADNIEIAWLYTNNPNSQSETIEIFLKNKEYSLLKKLKINNIIFLNHCADFQNYSYLEKSNHLKKIFNSDAIKIYKIK